MGTSWKPARDRTYTRRTKRNETKRNETTMSSSTMMRLLNKLPTLAAPEQTHLVKMLTPSFAASAQRRAFVNPQETVLDEIKKSSGKDKKETAADAKDATKGGADFIDGRTNKLKKSDKTGNSFRDVLGIQ